MEKKPVSHFTVGALIGIILIVLFLAYYFTGISYERGFLSYLPGLVILGMLIGFIIHRSKVNHGYDKFGALFGYGFKATAIFTIIAVAFTAIFVSVFPDYKQGFLEFMQQEFAKNPDLSDDQVDMMMDGMDRFFMISVIGGGVFMYLIMGVIGSLLGAAFAKKNPQPTPFEQL